jgi:hypothetical protein
MYVRSKILLLVVLPPQMWVLGDVRTVSVRPPCDLLRVRRAALSKRPCRAPSMNAASTRGIFVYAHTPSFQFNVCNTFPVMIPPWFYSHHP